jgi:two-component system sensor histidine kinase/response regulator
LVSVRDTGTGLSAEQIDGLFRPFMQARSDTSRHYGGTGLGLAISKRLVEMMGGEIWVESEPGLGSTFFFTIRLEEVADAISQASHSLQSKRILIVDDNASARAALGDMVEAFGMETVTVDGGLQALEVLRTRAGEGVPFDIVLLDWRMPIMDGIETARHIKADAQLEQMPAVLMVTAYSQDAVIRASDELELQGVLLKPVTQSLMFNTLLGILNDHSDVSHVSGHSHVSDAESQALRYVGLAGKRVLVTDDNALNREVATDFLEYVGVIVITAVDGRDAIRKLELQEFDAILMDMHMPEMDGLEATREIRRHAKWADLPIIALTAQTREEDQRLAMQAGMNGHLSKPIDEESLYAMLLAHCVSGKDAGAATSEPKAPTRATPALRRENLLRGFLRDFASLPEQVQHSADQGRWRDVAELAHQIKGSAGYLDATPLCAVAELLENAARQNDVEGARVQVEPLCRLTRECLDRVQAELAQLKEDSADAPAPESLQLAQAMALVDAALPLVARGDYRAQSVLDSLAEGMRGTPWHAMALEAREVFDDLELGRVSEILVQLRFCLVGDSTLETSSNG